MHCTKEISEDYFEFFLPSYKFNLKLNPDEKEEDPDLNINRELFEKVQLEYIKNIKKDTEK